MSTGNWVSLGMCGSWVVEEISGFEAGLGGEEASVDSVNGVITSAFFDVFGVVVASIDFG